MPATAARLDVRQQTALASSWVFLAVPLAFFLYPGAVAANAMYVQKKLKKIAVDFSAILDTRTVFYPIQKCQDPFCPLFSAFLLLNLKSHSNAS